MQCRVMQRKGSQKSPKRVPTLLWARDLIVVGEVLWMSAHYLGAELKIIRKYELDWLLGRICRHLRIGNSSTW